MTACCVFWFQAEQKLPGAIDLGLLHFNEPQAGITVALPKIFPEFPGEIAHIVIISGQFPVHPLIELLRPE